MSEAAQTETELLDRARAGDPLGMHQLLLLHHQALLMHVSAHIPVQFQAAIGAEDVCQEAYVSAIRKLPEFSSSEDGAFPRWLRVIAERKLTDAIRAQRAAKRGGGRQKLESPLLEASSTIALLQLLAIDDQTPSRTAARLEAVTTIRAGLERLAADYQEVIRLRFIEGFGIPETAARMERAEGAVRMLCSRALKALADELGDPARIVSRTG